MPQRYHNPFAHIHLVAPVDQREDYNRYCQGQRGRRAYIDDSPFKETVDFWFMGMALAAQKKLPPVNLTKQTTFNFREGYVFDRDSWRVQAVMLVAIAVEDDVKILTNPQRMMAIANGLAAAGVPHVVEMISDGREKPIWNLSDGLEKLLKGTAA